MHDGHRERMRNKYLQNGIDAMAPHEVLEMLLFYAQPRVNTNETAHRLLEEFGTFPAVLDADPALLSAVPGMGQSAVALIKLVKDCQGCYRKGQWASRPRLLTAVEAGAYLIDRIGDKTEEGFYMLCLDPARTVTMFAEVEHGTAFHAHVDTRKTVEFALKHRAYSVIFAHNHPAGRIQPSDNDLVLTKKLCDLFQTLGIRVEDHIIVGAGTYYSMAEKGNL